MFEAPRSLDEPKCHVKTWSVCPLFTLKLVEKCSFSEGVLGEPPYDADVWLVFEVDICERLSAGCDFGRILLGVPGRGGGPWLSFQGLRVRDAYCGKAAFRVSRYGWFGVCL